MKHRIESLPKWAQKILNQKDFEIKQLKGIREASGVLKEKEWFVIPNRAEEVMNLWLLFNDRPHPVCSLYKGDFLLVGRCTTKPKGEMG